MWQIVLDRGSMLLSIIYALTFLVINTVVGSGIIVVVSFFCLCRDKEINCIQKGLGSILY